MEDEEGYMPFNLRPKQGGSGGPSPAWNQGSRQCPGWLQVALGAGNLILAVTVLLLAVCGGSGCKLCPTDWQLRGDKCYWVSRRGKTWSESRADCSARGSQLLVIQDPTELEFIKDLTKHSHLFWIGLSVPSLEKAWTWLDGSRLDQTQFLVSDPVENSCGAVWGKWIHSDACSSVLHWICRRDAVPL
ncbi:killer cell lectin-like receptor subfamily F member 2 isoform X4 [Mauremys reevesii]|uniref:killer cell lectin-like receptor subfamily F member 2 isoform X4 n=1 Tax=Mauremys reevesii TaxID=260615 RepID=UPI00193ED3E8|nr:killer cell lectin-like receptor subfamily F member 2 isoform X4 [Mauremys reevesii]